ncbi:MAG: hypothetical protein HYS21_01680 [Deltaproteobacteria bacterium]|nr:hypothetical protein [Deltaproteobacteria bacterium]
MLPESHLLVFHVAVGVLEGGADVSVAEAQGQSWLQQNWRPLLMLTIIIIVANNYILYPCLSIFTDKVRVLDLPDRLWQLMEIGVGGYIMGRTVEKVRGRGEVKRKRCA